MCFGGSARELVFEGTVLLITDSMENDRRAPQIETPNRRNQTWSTYAIRVLVIAAPSGCCVPVSVLLGLINYLSGACTLTFLALCALMTGETI